MAKLKRVDCSCNRLLLKRAHDHQAEWIVKRRERTRQLIELGGLVVKAGLIELTDDDRAVLYGAFLATATTLRGEKREDALVQWRRRGNRAFDAQAQANEERNSSS